MEHEKKEVIPQEFPEEEPITRSQAKSTVQEKKRRHPGWWIFFLLVIVAGALFIQQTLAAWDAEAVQYAQQTADSYRTKTQESLSQSEKSLPEATTTATAIPATATVAPTDPSFVHTQTVAVQLTDVAEFQLTQDASE